jgi:hypothetical protein
VILVLAERAVVGWTISWTLQAQTAVIAAFQQAITNEEYHLQEAWCFTLTGAFNR